MTKVCSLVSWLINHVPFIHSFTHPQGSWTQNKLPWLIVSHLPNYHLTPAAATENNPRPTPRHCPCCHFSHGFVPQCAQLFLPQGIFTCYRLCLKWTSHKSLPGSLPHDILASMKCCFFKEPFLTSPPKKKNHLPIPHSTQLLWSWFFFIIFITSWTDIFIDYLFIVFLPQENVNVLRGDLLSTLLIAISMMSN